MNSKALQLVVLGFVAGAFGVLKVLSLAFWGGVWGIVLVWFMGRVRGADGLWVALVFGGVLPSLVGMLVVTPLKGGAITLEPTRMLLAFVINGVWGLGTALTYRFGRRLSAGSGLVRS